MPKYAHGTRQCYQAGCRLEQCRDAEAAYKRELRQRQREQVGEFAAAQVSTLSLVSRDSEETLINGNAVELAVQAEIDGLGSARMGLRAAAIALARILDNPKAVSTQPAAAAKLADILETLRKNSDSRKSKLASVRNMTKPQVKTG